ncbi:MAG: M28 family peptidase [Ignavibacteriae bacterium]|nr:M28 family peptidase [Ignavibacteriota bacterium]
MKNRFLTVSLFVLLVSGFAVNLNPQVVYDSKIDSMKNLISLQSISKIVRELSGDTITVIGGSPYRIFSRYWGSPSNPKAAQYIYEKFQSYGINVRYQNISSSCVNVIGKITGTLYPEQYYVVCGHYDNFKLDPVPGPLDTVPGADDNVSSISGILETAKLLVNFPLEYSVLFIAFDEEEKGLVGSLAFADSAVRQGMNLKGVINLEVLGYDSDNDGKFMLITNSNSEALAGYFLNAIQVYQIGLQGQKNFNGGYSDHYSFWLKGFKAITHAQSDSNFTPYEHTKYDTYDKFNPNYFLKMVKAAFVTLASLATDHGSIGINNLSNEIPKKYVLEQNYPNPFNPATNVKFSICNTQFVTLKIHDMLGREVANLVNEQLAPGTYEVDWNASQFPGGIYFYTLTAGDYMETKRMTMIK